MTSARDAVAKAYGALTEAFQKGDAETIGKLYDEDAELFIPGVPVIVGKNAIREAWKGIVGSGGSTVRVDVREVDEGGKFAFDTGHFTGIGPDGKLLNTGKWIVIWKRESSGEWKIYRDFMHWDIPPTPVP